MVSKKRDPAKHLRALCEVLAIVVPVKNLTEQEQLILHAHLKAKISTSQEPIKAESYFAWVIEKILVSPQEFFQFTEKNSEIFKHAVEQAGENSEFQVRTEILSSMFLGVLEVYPIFSLEGMLQLINSELIPGQPQPQEHKNPEFIVLNKKKIQEIQLHLVSNLIGQEDAIKSVVRNLKLLGANLESHFSLFFIGKTGIGKTHLAKLLATKFGDKLVKINCNEMTHGHEHAKLVGSPPGFVGHTEKSFLREKADKSNQWIFLFDEIEKATTKLFDFLLSLMDEGKIIDNCGVTLDFGKSIFLFSSNEGTDTLELANLNFSIQRRSESSTIEHLKSSLERKFKPEFLNRIDEIIYFNSLTREHARKIAEIELKKYPIRVTEDLISFVVDGGYSEKYGARNLNRFIKNNVTIILSELILDQELIGKSTYIPIFIDKKLNFRRIVHEVERQESSKEIEARKKAGAV